jgi:hypothetical protein
MNERYRTDPTYRDQVIATAHARRAHALGLGDARITISYLRKRDHNRCGICHQPVRAKRGPRGPSIDHVIPLKPKSGSAGTHTLANVQLAHLHCNRVKHNGGSGEQLALLG